MQRRKLILTVVEGSSAGQEDGGAEKVAAQGAEGRGVGRFPGENTTKRRKRREGARVLWFCPPPTSAAACCDSGQRAAGAAWPSTPIGQVSVVFES